MIVLGIVLLVIVASIAVYKIYSSKPVHVIDLKDPNSKLLKTITCDEIKILPKAWSWHATGKFQNFRDNYEYVMCSFAGYYQVSPYEKTDAFLDYSLDKYTDTVVLTQDSPITNDFQADQYFDLNLEIVGEKQFSKCAQNGQKFSCLVLAQYRESVLSIRFIGQNGLPLENVEALFNSLLTSFDISIRAQ